MNKERPSSCILIGNEEYIVDKKSNIDKSMTYVFKGKNGDSQMTIFNVFPGIKLVYHNVNTNHSFLGTSKKGNLIEIYHCRQGRIEKKYKEEYFYLTPGDLSVNIVKRNSDEYFFPLRHYQGITISINVDIAPKCFSCFMKDISIQPMNVAQKLCKEEECFIIRSKDYIAHLFYELYNVPCKDKISYFKVKILELLLILSGINPNENKINKYKVSSLQVNLAKQVADYLYDNSERKVVVKQICEKFHVSATHLQNAFKGVFGVTVYSYIRTQKIQMAAIELIKTNRSIIEIAIDIGYDNPSKFAAAFKDIMGEKPLEYRKQHSFIN